MPLSRNLAILLALLLTPVLAAETTVSSIIGNNMVVQRSAPVVLWGWDDAGTKVTVKIGDSSANATAADDGNWSVSLPAMKAAGVPELLKHLDGGCTLDEALGKAAAATRRLAKRQATWYRHQAADWTAVAGRSAQYSESLEEKFFPIIRRFLLTESG